jgi:ABC-type bacteriocin/lantibiotic exporter with double-glycine peptidase domain
MNLVTRMAVGFGMLLWLVVGCASREPARLSEASGNPDAHVVLIPDVPFFPQEDYYCGPASLASVLRFYGAALDQDTVAEQIYLPRLRGTLTLDMLAYPSRIGFKARSYRGSLDDLKRRLRASQPLILFLDLGSRLFPRYHYLVAIGFDERDQSVVAHSGALAHTRIPYRDLLAAWTKTDYWTLLIEPPSHPL